MIGKVTVKSREAYVLIEASRDSPPINGKFDSFLFPWHGCMSILESYLDAMDEDERATLTFSFLWFTDEELLAYCVENGIDWPEVLT